MEALTAPLAEPVLSVRAYRGGYAPHSHAHAQVLVGLSGSLQLEVEGRPSVIDPSCGIVIPAGARHGYLADTSARVVVVDCTPARGTDRLRCFTVPAPWRMPTGGWTSEAVLCHLAGAPSVQARRRLDLAVLARAVDADLHRAWTVAALAALCHFSPQHFRARFVGLTGLPPLAWVRSRRLDEAQRLLRAGLPLDAVALQVGYAGASALCFALRRERGTGARQLRAAAGPARPSSDV